MSHYLENEISRWLYQLRISVSAWYFKQQLLSRPTTSHPYCPSLLNVPEGVNKSYIENKICSLLAYMNFYKVNQIKIFNRQLNTGDETNLLKKSKLYYM